MAFLFRPQGAQSETGYAPLARTIIHLSLEGRMMKPSGLKLSEEEK
jgi:hypothetical protein